MARLQLPYALLSDSKLEFATSLRLPTFSVEDRTYIKRLTLIIRHARIGRVFYPVFPPDRNPTEVVAYLRGADGTGWAEA